MFDVLSSLQLHVSDRPYNSMSQTFGLTRATKNRIAQAYDNLENFPKNDENKCKEMNFQKFGCIPKFRKSPTSYLVG